MDAALLRIALPARYVLSRHLADGGMASVWEARDEILDRAVAVKVLAPPFASDEDAKHRFTREALAAARLSHHPHVVTTFDAGEHEGHAFLVMALYRGGTVAERLKAGPIGRARALSWLRGTAAALDAAHAEGVVHRDVKPANLLLDEDDVVAVGDFGIATAAWAASITRTGIVVGTAAYLAPEQREGRAATPASDRYALGVVAHELLTGRRPSETDALLLPPRAAAVLRAATDPDPDARPRTCSRLIEDLAAGLDATPRAPDPQRTRAMAVLPEPSPPIARQPRPPSGPPEATSTPAARLSSGGSPTSRDKAGRRRSRRAAAGAAGALALASGATAAVLLLGGGDDAGTAAPKAVASTPAANPRAPAADAPGPSAATTPAPAADPQATTPAPAATTPPPETATSTTPAPAADPDGRALNDRGKALLDDGDAAGAIPVLEQAVQKLSEGPPSLDYAFALFNLGHAYLEAGRPADAVGALEKRLEVNSDNQPGVVQKFLDRALAEAGRATPG